ncbi:MAG TPA: glycosyltransferase 87 family protein [Solirubrobacteraceae bacterium]|nr:glycosyltransferase 87 family protein [Solirubrobacteraceae bacterium]
MRRIARENVPCALAALACCGVVGWLGLTTFVWGDYETEALPAFTALVHGHLADFLRLAPAYGGSLVERAPFALVPGLWGGGSLAVYRAVALPCLLACALLAVVLVAHMRRSGNPLPARALAVLICAANPLALKALELGHPEELLGACLCVAAVLLAAEGRSLWAGLALGLAVANKEWALLAAAPVLLALAPRRRAACAAFALAVAAALLAPLLLAGSGGFAAAARASATPPGTIFHPWQLFWFFGHPAGTGASPSEAGAVVGPAWTGAISHPAILAVGALLGLALWWRQGRGSAIGLRPALLALALLLMLRCLLDTWDTGYYMLPMLLALLAWEATGPPMRLHPLAALATALASLTFLWLPNHASGDVQAAVFLAWSLPLAALLAQRLSLPGAQLAPGIRNRLRRLAAQEMTVRPFSKPLRTS